MPPKCKKCGKYLITINDILTHKCEGSENVKYTKEEYENIDFTAGEEDITNHTQKIVKTRKIHQCAYCQKEINSGENAIREKGFMDGQPVSCYHCIDCCDKLLDESNE